MNDGLDIDEDGTKRWYVNGLRHREDGPAVVYYDGDKEWYKDGKRHRLDGPAVVYYDGDYDGDKECEWYLGGELVYCDAKDNTSKFTLNDAMKLSIIKYKLKSAS